MSSGNCNCGTAPNFIQFDQFVESCYNILGLTSGDNYSLGQISGYFLSSASVGKLNNSINSSYKLLPIFSGADIYWDTAHQKWDGLDTNSGNSNITGLIVCPPMPMEVLALFQTQYTYDYYTTLANTVIRSSMSAQGGLQSLKEADNQIVFLNKNQIAANIRNLAKDAKSNLDYQIADYLRFQVGAGSVVYSEDCLNLQPYMYGNYGWGYGPYGYGGYWGTAYWGPGYYGGRRFYT